VKKIDIRTVKS